MNRQEAESKLKKIFQLNKFYDSQWEAIENLLQGKRVLLIEKTGFGKSLCYQFPATQFDGVTIVFSPLIALMRDQVNKLKFLNISAESINSEQSLEENRTILEQAKRGEIKILYIAPERQESREWLNTVRDIPVSMIVIDEAHCISVWGHDFRPAFKKIVDLINLFFSKNIPILATTATATEKVAEDIKKQIGDDAILIKGNLLRDNFHLRVFQVETEEDKMSWLAEYLPKLKGTGIIYTGTRADTEIYAKWLQSLGCSAINYNAGLDGERRKEIEKGLMENQWQCIVSTNALGMGLDKPDIRFIIHTQMPASPIHYYQEIGRAGRDGKTTMIVLLYSPKDKELITHFIENSKPSLKKYEQAIDCLKRGSLGLYDLIRKLNLKKNQVDVILSDLLENGIIKQVSIDKRTREYEYQKNATQFDISFFEDIRQFKTAELNKMIEYTQILDCRMNYLCNYLGDCRKNICGKCDNDLKQNNVYSINCGNEIKEKLHEFKSNFFPLLRVETKKTTLINGVAGSYYGFSEIGSIIHKCKYENEGDFPDSLVNLTIKAFRKFFKGEQFDLIVYVSPTESGNLVENFAEKISKQLDIPIFHNLKKQKQTQPQKKFESSLLKRDNVKDAFIYLKPDEIEEKSILVIDDIFDSGATIKEIGKLLTELGAVKIAPLVIAKTVGSDVTNADYLIKDRQNFSILNPEIKIN